MSDRYVVPEGGLKAAREAADKFAMSKVAGDGVKEIIEAFIRWQSENSIIPTQVKWNECVNEAQKLGYPFNELYARAAVEWQRRMYRVAETKVEKENMDKTILDDMTLTDKEIEQLGIVYRIEGYIKEKVRGMKMSSRVLSKFLFEIRDLIASIPVEYESESLPLQCGERIEVRGEMWEVQSIVNGSTANMKKVVPELEVPEEIIDLLEPVNDYRPSPSADFRIMEAYRRGQKSGAK